MEVLTQREYEITLEDMTLGQAGFILDAAYKTVKGMDNATDHSLNNGNLEYACEDVNKPFCVTIRQIMELRDKLLKAWPKE